MSDDYEVGYGKPPISTRFKPGKSGNTDGRKKGSQNISTLIRKALEEKVVVNTGGKRRSISKMEAAFLQQSTKAAGGDLKATKLMMELLHASESHERGGQSQADLTPAERRARSAKALAILKARIEDDDE